MPRCLEGDVQPPKPSTNLSTLTDADRAQVAKLRGTDPGRLSLLLRGDLDWIVMRCLEKNRTRRYDTPSALAADIARHLRNEPVVARPPSRAYRIGRLVRRNRLAFAAAASVALALLTGSVVSTWQAVRATRAEGRANAERARAEDLLKFMLGDLYTQLDKVGRLDVLDAVADKATAYFASLGPSELNDTTRFSRARALRLLGGVRTTEARYPDAIAALSEAYRQASDLAARHPKDGEMLFERGQAEFGIAFVHWRLAEYAEAGEWLNRYHATSKSLVALDPTRADWQLEQADGEYNLAALAKERGDLDSAKAQFIAELSTLKGLIAADPDNLELRSREEDAHNYLGTIADLQGDFPAALEQYSLQVSLLESIAAKDPKTVGWRNDEAIALLYRVTIEMVTGRYDAASDSLGKAQKLLAALVAHDPKNVEWEGTYMIGRITEASLARRRGDAEEAGRILGEAMGPIEAAAAEVPTDQVFGMLVPKAWRLRAQLQAAAGDPGAAGSAAHAVEMGEKRAGAKGASDADVGDCAKSHVISGEIAAASGDAAAARKDWLRAAELLAARARASRDWRLLDPQARAQAWLGRLGDARSTINRLTTLGYVPIDPWPDLDGLAAAKSSDPQPK